MAKQLAIRTITVNAINRGNFFILIDRRGRRLSRAFRLSDVEGYVDPVVLDEWHWKSACSRIRFRLLSRSHSRKESPWKKRVSNLAASHRMRRRLPRTKPISRQRFERYSTKNWNDACRRLWQQGDNRARRHSRGGWVRWAHTVSNNHNKRKGGRYGQDSYRNNNDDHAND